MDWDRGIVIRVEPFGTTDLSMQQMDDFRPGKPGTEAVRLEADYYGVFLLDTNRPYDNQAAEALRRAHASKKGQLDSMRKNIRDYAARAGVSMSDDALQELEDSIGITQIAEKVSSLASQLKKYAKLLEGSEDRNTQPQYDPTRTVFVTEPPREFPSVAAMEFFLDSNPEIKQKHEALNNASESVVENA
jgi:hypothetical protein